MPVPPRPALHASAADPLDPRSPSLPRGRSLPALLLALVATAVVAVATVLPAAPARADVGAIDRVAGDDRIRTAVAASQAGWSSADHVVVSVSDDYPDAIAASAFAATADAPVLLTHGAALPPAVAAEIDRLGATEVTVLGGADTIADSVVDDLGDVVADVDRVAGDDRFDTAGRLAARTGLGDGERVAVALGRDRGAIPGWPDAMSAGTLAALDEPVPTLLTDHDDLPQATAAAIRDLGPSEVLVVGGEAAVSEDVVAEIRELGVEVRRVAGSNRYHTSVAVAQTAVSAGVGSDAAVFVSGESFVDALGAAAVAARQRAPMLLVPSARLADSVDDYLRKSPIREGMLVGGPAAVDDFVASELDAAITGAARPTPPPPPEPEPEPEPVAASYNGHTFRFDLAIWDRLARCESGERWSINTGNGYYGGIQFSLASWRAVGGAGYPHRASRLEQIYRGELLQARQGWGAWPACSRKLGLR